MKKWRNIASWLLKYRARAVGLIVAIGILWFVSDSISRSVDPYETGGYYDLSRISANEVHLSIDSFDPDTAKVHVTATPKFGSLFLISEINLKNPNAHISEGLDEDKLDVRLGQVYLSDLSTWMQNFGLQMAQKRFGPPPPSCTVASSHADEQSPSDSWKVLSHPLIGSNYTSGLKGASAYPFDEYLVTGRVVREAVLCYEGRSYPVSSDLNVSIDFSGFSIRDAEANELRNWPNYYNSLPPKMFHHMIEQMPEPARQAWLNPPPYDVNLWHTTQVALVIQRPLALRRMTILLFGITTFAIFGLAFTCPVGDVPRNFAGSLFAIWTVRGLLNSNAPKSPTLLDFLAMALFASVSVIYICRYAWSHSASEATSKQNQSIT
jgi:hypothetical protein